MLRSIASFGRRVALALVIVVLLFAGLYVLSGIWPERCVPALAGAFHVRDSGVGLLAVNASTGRLYLSVDDAFEIAVYDTARLGDYPTDDEPIARIPTDGYHGGMAIDEVANRIYVGQSFAGKVKVIDGLTNDSHDLAVPGLVHAMSDVVVDPARGRLYVSRNDNGDVAIFDTATERFLGAVGKGCCSNPSIQLAVDPVRGLLHIAALHDGRLTTWDGARQVGEVPLPGGAGRIALLPEEGILYATLSAEVRVARIDVDPDSPTAFTEIGSFALKESPQGLLLDHASRLVYTTNNTADTLSIIDLALDRHVLDVPIGTGMFNAALDPSSGRAYVAHSAHQVQVMRTCPARVAAGGKSGRPRATPTRSATNRPTAEPSATPDATQVAARRLFVRCNRMYRIREDCFDGSTVREAALAIATVRASGAEVAPTAPTPSSSATPLGPIDRICGIDPQGFEPDYAAAGYYYSVPVLEPDSATPAVWTFHSASLTFVGHSTPTPLPTEGPLVTPAPPVPTVRPALVRVLTPPTQPWAEALWYLSRYKTRLAPEAVAGCQ